MAYQYPLNGGRINASVGGNSTSAGAGYQLVSTGTLHLAGGNNVTLQQNGNSISISGVSYANSNGVSFGLNNGTLTASVAAASQSVQTIGGYASGNTTGQSSSTTFDARSLSISATGGVSAGYSAGMLQMSAPAVSSLSQTGIISISRNGNTISIGAPAFSAGMSTGGNSAGTAGTASNQIIFAGGNNVTLSQSTGTDGNTLSIAGPSLSNSNGFTFGTNGSVVTASYAGITSQSAQTANFYASSNSTQLSSTAGVDLRSITFQGAGGASVGVSAGKVLVSVNSTYAASNHSHGNPTLNLTNISGTTASASNGLTLSLSAAAQSVQTQSNIQGIIASGSTNRTGDISFANSNGVTFGLSNNTITASVAAGGGGGVALAGGGLTATSGTANLVGSGAISVNSTTGQSFVISAPAQSNLSATGAVSISNNGNTISIGAPVQTNQTLGMYIASNSITNATTSGTVDARSLTFRGVGNASVGISNGSVIVSASGGGGGGGVALSAAGGSITSGTASFSAGGALTASVNGQTLSLNAPATSMLSAGDGISISTTGSTVVFQGVPTTGAGGNITWSYFNPQDAYALVAGQHGNGTLHFQPAQAPNVQYDRIALPMILSNATSLSGSQTVSLHVGIFTRNDSTLSLASSTSASYAMTQSGTAGSYSLFGGQRLFTIGSTNTLLQGQYYIGIMSRTSSAGANASISQLVASQIASNYSGVFGEASNATVQQTRGLGYFSASTSAMPSSVALSQLRGTNSMALRQPAIYFVSQTF